jgi:hypothetical protein
VKRIIQLPVGLPCNLRVKALGKRYVAKNPCDCQNKDGNCERPGACVYSSQHVCTPMPKKSRQYGRGIILRPRGEAACDAFDRGFSAEYE